MQQTEKVRPIIHENTKELSGEDTTMQLKPEEISKIIRAQIKHYENVIEQSEVGTVILVGDGIARASGLEKCMAGELLQFCLLYTSPSPRDKRQSRMPSSA